jgi:hypothetical protein
LVGQQHSLLNYFSGVAERKNRDRARFTFRVDTKFCEISQKITFAFLYDFAKCHQNFGDEYRKILKNIAKKFAKHFNLLAFIWVTCQINLDKTKKGKKIL